MTTTTRSRNDSTTGRYRCASCRHEPADDAGGGGAMTHCEVCGAWVAAAQIALPRDLVLPLQTVRR